jgi:hypothetical protein
MKFTVRTVALLCMVLLGGCRSSILEDPSTMITFAVTAPSHVRVTVENSYNTVVATLVDADLNPGYHAVAFNSTGLQSGVYFYVVETREINSSTTVKTSHYMLLIK